MDSPASVSRCVPQNYKKRLFPPGSSSSACKEAEVLENSPPDNSVSKPESSKQNEVIITEVIDVDTDMEDDYGDLTLTDGVADPSVKGKDVLLNSPVGLGSFTDGESESSDGGVGFQDSTDVDEFSNSLFYGEDEWIDTYYDDIVYDDFAVLESHFDHMDIPSGVEAPVPWFPSSHGNNSKVSSSSTSSLHHHPNGASLSPDIQMNANNHHKKKKLSSKLTDHVLGKKKSTTSNGTSNMSSQIHIDALAHKLDNELLKSKRNAHAHQILYSNYHNLPPSPPIFESDVNGGGSHTHLSIPTNAPGPGTNVLVFQDFPLGMLEPPSASSGFSHTSGSQGSASNQNAPSSSSLEAGRRNTNEILQKFEQYKKFDTVEDYSDHHYRNSSSKQHPKNWAKKVQDEWMILEKDLPDKIFVRVYESRMDLLRAVIVGAEGTPYHDGLFFFDFFFPGRYPHVPPLVHYHSGGLCINPNLYKCGKVCLSLLNTWSGEGTENWIPGESTMLQVLVSIQGLILNAKPFFNEPGYASLSGSAGGEKSSLEYNEKIFMYSLQTMVYSIRRPPMYFEDLVMGHFCKHAVDILVSCKAYLGGAQVGCVAKGDNKSHCSEKFKMKLAGFIIVLVNTFSQAGAKDCHEFLPLAASQNELR